MDSSRILVVATRNRKKGIELSELLEGLPFEVRTLDFYPDCPEVIEDGETFEANSEKKAREVSSHTGEWVVADDSGLEVDVLGGEPGVYSARYGGLDDDHSRNQYLLDKLAGRPPEERSARFVCCATLFGDGKVIYQVRATCEGRILHTPRGAFGFGYDPIFQPDGFNCSIAELPPSEKHRISHRGKALREIRKFFERQK